MIPADFQQQLNKESRWIQDGLFSSEVKIITVSKTEEQKVWWFDGEEKQEVYKLFEKHVWK